MNTVACTLNPSDDLQALTKIAIRDFGHRLLLINKDSSALVLPIRFENPNKYLLNFNTTLAIEPGQLIIAVEESFEKAKLSDQYRIEVKTCDTQNVVYSFQRNALENSTLIPCIGRGLPKSCYIIEVVFITNANHFVENKNSIIFVFVLLVVSISVFYIKLKRSSTNSKSPSEIGEKLGNFYFYPEQNKLVIKSEEIALSKKECELLSLFVSKPNQILKRDELTKRVWEDKGVFVGRSLDTYISKLRKKLKSDSSIKLTNVHGVGYKLEINE
ncbi:winged helix-turn-helix transcriptional regulator [Winogradskyella eckloniae]|uniref:winged helix-turn-helix domain-containing protein n=1 Tax=Winogradskyella eckloniae TaxID=1089306 RepID=UPI001564E642|nr:winged helix-turn-helix domain-containing protein [Winogradskyella eckloniae]NRD20015.1 winged helix-turn-helix transcriptional regulator [Winogradskyella eckloniae]